MIQKAKVTSGTLLSANLCSSFMAPTDVGVRNSGRPPGRDVQSRGPKCPVVKGLAGLQHRVPA
jgi:hypothetical protein